MGAAVASAIIVVENTAGCRGRRVIGTVHCGPAVCVANIVHLALLKQCVILVSLTAGWRTHISASRAEVVIIILEVVGRVRRERSLALSGEGGIGDCVGESTGATEVHHIAEGDPSGDGKEDARRLSN